MGSNVLPAAASRRSLGEGKARRSGGKLRQRLNTLPTNPIVSLGTLAMTRSHWLTSSVGAARLASAPP
jgi:hypothetical protein